MFTIRQEIAKRLCAYRKIYRKKVDSYNKILGIGRVPKNKNMAYSGWSINGSHYINGVKQEIKTRN